VVADPQGRLPAYTTNGASLTMGGVSRYLRLDTILFDFMSTKIFSSGSFRVSQRKATEA
jgi:hypothetical protein